MKSCAGITQHVEISEEYIEREFERHKELVFVGPFQTSMEAIGWLEYMMAHSRNAEEISLPGYCIDSSPWYGVAFQCEKEASKRLYGIEQFPVLSGH